MSQDDGGYKLYHYDPSMAAAVVFVILFSATSVLHGWQMVRSRCNIAIPLVIGGLRMSPLLHERNSRSVLNLADQLLLFSGSYWIYWPSHLQQGVTELDFRSLHPPGYISLSCTCQSLHPHPTSTSNAANT